MYQKGDVVLVPFPFTDLSSSKTRPAVVVNVEEFERETGNLTVAMITSVRHETSFDCEIKDWKAAHLLTASWVRMKFATLEPSLVRYQPGKLTKGDMTDVDKKIRHALGL